MSDALRVQWTIVSQTAPQPWLNCTRCGGPKPFRSSGRIRINANGRRLDAWLIYKCASCESTWNRPILERQPVEAALAELRGHERTLVDRLEFDTATLRRHAHRVDEFQDAVVTRQMLSPCLGPARRMEILCIVPRPTALRLDRLLARELELSRRRIQSLSEQGCLVVTGNGARALARPVRDGLRVSIDMA
jgi:hypothetical protein